MLNRLSPLLVLVITGLQTALTRADQCDILIYGGTSAGVAAAVQAARMGKSVILIEPGRHVGGLTVSGLGWTDTGNKAVIGGVSREFYQRIKRHYDQDSAWRQEQRDGYKTYRKDDDAMWAFEPHVAERVFNEMLREANVQVVLGTSMTSANNENGRINSINTQDAMTRLKTYRSRVFIDATYEGDLMMSAGVNYAVGRESNDQFGETLNGVQIRNAIHHQFVKPVDPYVIPGDKTSGLLPGINTDPGEDGTADERVQTYNFRICMTDAPDNRVPFDKPEGYDERDHELLLRNFEAGDLRIPLSIQMLPNRKTDLNNNFAVSTDWIGMNYYFPDDSYENRDLWLRDLETYTRGFLWTLQNHPRVPEELRKQVAKWGYAKDEFTDNNHWPYWCYIREARRMVSDYVQTEMDCKRSRKCDDPVGMGSYNMDSHNCQRYVDKTGHVRNEGDVQVSPGGPYLISYRAIVPKKAECSNLLVPVCLSASHIAYGSIRMEPVFMILGQSAATAACLAIDDRLAVQDVPYAALRERLLADKQVLDIPPGSTAASGINPKSLVGIVVDDTDATKTGAWLPSHSVGGFVGIGYLHDNNEQQGQKSVRFELPIKVAGTYDVRISYTPNPNRATNVRVMVASAADGARLAVNQQKPPPIEKAFVSLGKFRFEPGQPATVIISNDGANGHVIADAVWAVPE